MYVCASTAAPQTDVSLLVWPKHIRSVLLAPLGKYVSGSLNLLLSAFLRSQRHSWSLRTSELADFAHKYLFAARLGEGFVCLSKKGVSAFTQEVSSYYSTVCTERRIFILSDPSPADGNPYWPNCHSTVCNACGRPPARCWAVGRIGSWVSGLLSIVFALTLISFLFWHIFADFVVVLPMFSNRKWRPNVNQVARNSLFSCLRLFSFSVTYLRTTYNAYTYARAHMFHFLSY